MDSTSTPPFPIFEFEESLKHFPLTRVRVSITSTKKYFPCDAVVSFLLEYKSVLCYGHGQGRYLEDFISYILKLLLKYDCSDMQFVTRILDLYHICKSGITTSYWCEDMRINILSRATFALEKFVKEYEMPENAVKINILRESIDHLVRGWKYGELNFMKVLSKYGFTSASPSTSFHYYKNTRNILFDFGFYVFMLRQDKSVSTANFLRSWDDLPWPDCGVAKPSFNRIILIIKGMDPVWETLHGKTSNGVKCFRLYFQSISDPFLTISEVKGFVTLLTEVYVLKEVVLVDRIVDAFRALYPEYEDAYNPTTLQHMCRCKVREEIRQHGSLPIIVEKMNISKRIKNYILFP